MRSQAKLKQIAVDIYKGQIFTDRHLSPEMLTRVFIPLLFLDRKQVEEEFKNNPPGLIFEYLDKAGPLSVNGQPMFFSFQILSQEEVKEVFEIVNKLQVAEKQI